MKDYKMCEIVSMIQKFSDHLRSKLFELDSKYTFRERKIDVLTVIVYRLLYSQINKTQTEVIGYINYYREIITVLSSYHEKEIQLPISVYENLYYDISSYTSSIMNEIEFNETIIFDVDGTYNHIINKFCKKSKSRKGNEFCPLNLGVYNATQKCPVYLQKLNHSNERMAFIEFIGNSKEDLTNSIFTFDAGFFSFDFIKQLTSYDITYIIRLRENLKIITKNFQGKEKHARIEINIDGNDYIFKIIKYTINKKNYYLATNLMDRKKYSNDQLKKIYRQRWDIEEFFKYIKKTTKFDDMYEKDETSIKKMYFAILIVCRIVSFLEFIFDKYFNIDNDKKQINKSLLKEGFYQHLLLNIVYNKNITEQKINLFIGCYVKYLTIVNDRHFPHVCINPNKKWYTKQNLNALK
jgi:hypothetical protein